jgi:predicted MFS family arabinose efflux permease
MDQFLGRFPRVSAEASGAGFWKGLMTAMLELGALLGALFAGYLADRLSRKHSIVVSVVVFMVGSILQTAAVEYSMLTVGRLIGGMGIGAQVSPR